MPIKLMLSVLILSASAEACSCRPLTVREAVYAYDVVFSGEISKVTYVDDPSARSPRIIVSLRVFHSWKGATDSEVVMHTRRRDGTCEGFSRPQIQIGQRLLVYATWISTRDWPDAEVLTTDACSRTQLIQNAKQDLRVLESKSADY
jgi:hypothetical protein